MSSGNSPLRHYWNSVLFNHFESQEQYSENPSNSSYELSRCHIPAILGYFFRFLTSMVWSLSQIRRKHLKQVLSNPEAMTIFYWSVWPNLEPSLSPLSYSVAKRKTLVGPFHQTTQNLGGKKIGWQRGWQSQETVSGTICQFTKVPIGYNIVPAWSSVDG